MAASSWPSPASLEFHSAISLPPVPAPGLKPRSFPSGNGREGMSVQSSEEEGPATSIGWGEVAWEKEVSHESG